MQKWYGASHHLVGSIGSQISSFGAFPKSPIYIKKDTLITFITWKIPMVLRGSGPGTRWRTKYTFLIKVHSITPYLVRTLEGLRVTEGNK